jgi:hypothetical protein
VVVKYSITVLEIQRRLVLMGQTVVIIVATDGGFLGAFAKLRKANISFVMSVCPSVRPSVRPSVCIFAGGGVQ